MDKCKDYFGFLSAAQKCANYAFADDGVRVVAKVADPKSPRNDRPVGDVEVVDPGVTHVTQ